MNNKMISIRVFILGIIGWTLVSAFIPISTLLYRWITLWQDAPDWRIIGPVAMTSGIAGAVAFVLKYRALVQLPPAWAEAAELISGMKRETTVAVLSPSGNTLTTVKETEMVPPNPEPGK